jgi:type II restriction/modification system DNA methylase subunit YeeA
MAPKLGTKEGGVTKAKAKIKDAEAKADAIIGNPPFLGGNAMIGTLGEDYTARLRAAYAGRLPGGVDLVCYWFERAREEVTAGRTHRVGLVATQAIRKGASRSVLDRIQADATIFDAWSTEPWNLDGADVRVSLVAFAKQHDGPVMLDGAAVPTIHADLSGGGANLTTARGLAENMRLSFQGPVKVGPFDVDGTIARGWLTAPLNANGKPNTDVVRPIMNTADITGRSSDTWIVDFASRTETARQWKSRHPLRRWLTRAYLPAIAEKRSLTYSGLSMCWKKTTWCREGC